MSVHFLLSAVLFLPLRTRPASVMMMSERGEELIYIGSSYVCFGGARGGY